MVPDSTAEFRRKYGANSVALDTETTGVKFSGPHRLRLTVAVIWSAKTGCLHYYREGDLGALAFLLDTADSILIHNQAFDHGVLGLYFNHLRVAQWRRKTFDLFETIREHEGTWVGLGAMCEINNKPTKSGTGCAAVRLWREGKFNELAAYCAQDVIIMVLVMQLRTVLFCQKRRDLQSRLQTHIGLGSIDTTTLKISTRNGVRPPDFQQECPCDRPRVLPPVTAGLPTPDNAADR
jgi:hypothetical protein